MRRESQHPEMWHAHRQLHETNRMWCNPGDLHPNQTKPAGQVKYATHLSSIIWHQGSSIHTVTVAKPEITSCFPRYELMKQIFQDFGPSN